MLENAATISADDKTRFEAQQQCITKIIAIYEEPAYNDADPAKSAEVVNLMNEVSTALISPRHPFPNCDISAYKIMSH